MIFRCRRRPASHAIPARRDCSCLPTRASCTSSNDPGRSRSVASSTVATTRLAGTFKPPCKKFSTVCITSPATRHSLLATSSRFTGHRPQATIPTPHAPRTSICRYQRGQVVRRLSPTGYCLTPTADFPMNSVVLICTCMHYRLPPPVHGPSGSRAPARRLAKTERGPSSMSDPSTLSMSPNQATLAEKSVRFSSLAAAQPLNILSRPETLNASGSRRACRRPSAAVPVLSLISPRVSSPAHRNV